MTDKEAAEKMAKFVADTDNERAHIRADELLLDLLREKYPLTVETFNKGEWWYA
jgi:hypothetical protein